MNPLVAPPPPRSPWQRLYAAAHALRRRRAAGRAARLPVPVVSVGNLLWGGAGKTPFVLALARHLRDRGVAVGILSRGYGRASRGVLLVSSGGAPLVPVEQAGDEAFLLARELPGVPVAVARRRVEAGRLLLAECRPAPRVLLLDDGFSHVALARDLDLLLIPLADPFGGGRLAPSGRLREPLASVAAADAAILTGLERAALPATGSTAIPSASSGEALARALAPLGFRGAAFASATATELAVFGDGRPLTAGARVVAVAAIARPELFFAAARRLGFDLAAELRFPDHHSYPGSSLERIARAARATGVTAVLTTAKDRAKLEGRIDAPLAHLPIRALPEPAFWRFFDARVDALLA